MNTCRYSEYDIHHHNNMVEEKGVCSLCSESHVIPLTDTLQLL